MNIRKAFALLLLAVLLKVDSLGAPYPPDAAGQRKARAAAKKQPPAKAERPVSDTAGEQSEVDNVERITVEELKSKITKNEPLTIIDDRSQGSYDASETQIKGSIRMTVDEIQSRLKEIPRDREIITYCT